MINAEARNNYYVACGYAEGLAKFIELDTIPARPMGLNTNEKIQTGWMMYYFELLHAIITKETEIIKDVRVRYGKGSKDIPRSN